MVFSVVVVVAVAIISFVIGILVGRNNKSIVEDIVGRYKSDFDAVVSKLQDLEKKVEDLVKR